MKMKRVGKQIQCFINNKASGSSETHRSRHIPHRPQNALRLTCSLLFLTQLQFIQFWWKLMEGKLLTVQFHTYVGKDLQATAFIMASVCPSTRQLSSTIHLSKYPKNNNIQNKPVMPMQRRKSPLDLLTQSYANLSNFVERVQDEGVCLVF